MTDINYIFNNFAVVLVKGGDLVEVRSDEKPELFQRVVTLCMRGDKEEAFDLITDSSQASFLSKRLPVITDGMLAVDSLTDEVVFVAGDRRIPIVSTFATKIRDAWQKMDTAAIAVYKKFMVKAVNNPNDVSASDLFEFITVNKLPLSIDGDVLAYKIVRSNFLDLHSGTKDHTPGKVVEEEDVDYDRAVTCSRGLHFCSKDYLPQYGGFFGRGDDTNRLVLLKVDPSDVAAFPRDYNNAKGRCRKYTVVSELPTSLFTAVVNLMETVPFVDINALGAPSDVVNRLGQQVVAHTESIAKAVEEDTTFLVLKAIAYDPKYRWYVTVGGSATRTKFVKHFNSRKEAREYRDSLRARGDQLGIRNPVVSVYDGEE